MDCNQTSILVQVDPIRTGPNINPGLITHNSNFSSSVKENSNVFNIVEYMLWFNFILGSISIFFCFRLSTIHYHTQKQRKIKIEPRIKLNHNVYNKKLSGGKWFTTPLNCSFCINRNRSRNVTTRFWILHNRLVHSKVFLIFLCYVCTTMPNQDRTWDTH